MVAQLGQLVHIEAGDAHFAQFTHIARGHAVIAQVVPGSPADRAGLQTGDIIESIGGRAIESVPDASYNIRLNMGENTEMVLRRTDPITREVSGCSGDTSHSSGRARRCWNDWNGCIW